MLFRTLSAAVYGIDANLVEIEVNLTPVRGEADIQDEFFLSGILPQVLPGCFTS